MSYLNSAISITLNMAAEMNWKYFQGFQLSSHKNLSMPQQVSVNSSNISTKMSISMMRPE